MSSKDYIIKEDGASCKHQVNFNKQTLIWEMCGMQFLKQNNVCLSGFTHFIWMCVEQCGCVFFVQIP